MAASDNSNAKNSDRQDRPSNAGQGSRDALRHEKDAQHHKFHKHDRQSQARAQQDSADMQQTDGLQPEVPKVGSRDAPGG